MILEESTVNQFADFVKIGKCNTPLSKGVEGFENMTIFFLSMDCNSEQLKANIPFKFDGLILQEGDNKFLVNLDSTYDYIYFYDVEIPKVTVAIHHFDKDSLRILQKYNNNYVSSKIKL